MTKTYTVTMKRGEEVKRVIVNGMDEYDALFVAETQNIQDGWIARSAKEVCDV